jgi:hypothetical protein
MTNIPLNKLLSLNRVCIHPVAAPASTPALIAIINTNGKGKSCMIPIAVITPPNV